MNNNPPNPPCNTDLTDVERLYPAALKRLAEQTELIVELETKLAAMQQPVHADEVERVPSGYTAETWAAKQAEVAEFSRRNAFDEPGGSVRKINAEARLKAARDIQCSDVPNEFALVRRIDLSFVLGELTRHRAGHELAIKRRKDAALLVSNSGVEAGWVNIPEPTADDFAEVGEAVEGAMLSEQSWPEIGEIAWRILSRDREITDWSNATRGKFLNPPTIPEKDEQ